MSYDQQLADAYRDNARLRDVVDWVETWLSAPVSSYSVCALDGLFGMTRDKIAALRDAGSGLRGPHPSDEAGPAVTQAYPDPAPKFETPYNTARRIVCEEWHRGVDEFRQTPGSVTETVVSRIINRLDATVWPAS